MIILIILGPPIANTHSYIQIYYIWDDPFLYKVFDPGLISHKMLKTIFFREKCVVLCVLSINLIIILYKTKFLTVASSLSKLYLRLNFYIFVNWHNSFLINFYNIFKYLYDIRWKYFDISIFLLLFLVHLSYIFQSCNG